MGTRRGNDLQRPLALVASHPAVSNVGPPSHDEERGITSVNVTFDVSLPNEWRRCRRSPSGVRLQEVVRFDFPIEFPMNPPRLSLRADFNRNLPHMQPWLDDGRPVPCIYDGDLADLLHQNGLASFVNQTAVWLERAALDKLVDPEQGWEPVRRNSFRDVLIADADSLRSFVDRKGGCKFLGLSYLRMAIDSRTDFVHGQISTETAKLTHKTAPDIFEEFPVDPNSQFIFGKSVALVAWPGKQPSGAPVISDVYLPETVTSVGDLKERAAMYGCTTALNNGLRWLEQCFRGYPTAGPFCFVVVLMPRRPCNVIGSRSPIELCTYVLDIVSPDLYTDGNATAVRPAGHHHTVSRSLLVQMSGGDTTRQRPRWTLVGAGSLGSKLALHLARAGNGPEVVVDRSTMTPHNAARHALIPMTGDMQILWSNAKATVLCDSLRGLDQTATPIIADASNILMSNTSTGCAWSKRSWAVVNATASSAVREAFAFTNHMPTRVIETTLFARGRVGMITVEGPNRNPNTNDLMAECYALLRYTSTLSEIVFNGGDTITLHNVGQGCSSLTMTMSDGRLSLFSAGMAEYLLGKQRDGLPPDKGEVIIGRLSGDGLGLQWQVTPVPPVVLVRSRMNGKTWCIHVHQRVVEKIESDVARWPTVETGGVLMGRLSELSRTVQIVDILDPPEDSERSASCFVLGTIGLRKHIENYSNAVGWSLYCLGTWHSHLDSSGPSMTDRATAKAVSLARITPSVSLIHTPTGFHAFLAGAEKVHVERN